MKVQALCEKYFSGFEELTAKKSSVEARSLAVLKILSYATLIIPFIMAVTYGITKLADRNIKPLPKGETEFDEWLAINLQMTDEQKQKFFKLHENVRGELQKFRTYNEFSAALEAAEVPKPEAPPRLAKVVITDEWRNAVKNTRSMLEENLEPDAFMQLIVNNIEINQELMRHPGMMDLIDLRPKLAALGVQDAALKQNLLQLNAEDFKKLLNELPWEPG